MRREDIYRQMERNGDYSEAENYRRTCEDHGHSMYERVSWYGEDDIRDGCGHSYAGDRAVEAADDIRRAERREEQRREEEEELRREEERQYAARQRQIEEEEYYATQNIPEEPIPVE